MFCCPRIFNFRIADQAITSQAFGPGISEIGSTGAGIGIGKIEARRRAGCKPHNDLALAHSIADKAEEAIAEIVGKTPDALLVMGAYGHSPLRALIVGSTTTALIRTVHAPVLLVR